MHDKIEYTGTVSETGKLTIQQRKTMALDIATKFSGSDVKITIEKITGKPSNRQYGYLFGVIIPRIKVALRREQGYIFTDKETRFWVEQTFLLNTHVSNDGEIRSIPRSIGDLEKHELSELIDSLIVMCAQELNEIIPFPDERED